MWSARLTSSLKAGYQPGQRQRDINVDNEGHFNGSREAGFIPLQDKQRYLTRAAWSLRNRPTTKATLA